MLQFAQDPVLTVLIYLIRGEPEPPEKTPLDRGRLGEVGEVWPVGWYGHLDFYTLRDGFERQFLSMIIVS